MIGHSPTLAANERIRDRIARGDRVVHLAFGEAGLPVHPALIEVLARGASRNSYPPVVGERAAREACAGYFARRGLDADADRVVLAPGSKSLLYALLAALPGDVVLPAPCWVSYAAQATLGGKRVIDVPIPPESGGVPDPRLLDERLSADGRTAGVLVLTTPDNPTGTVAEGDLVREVCEVARRHDLIIIADEIYADITHSSAPQRVSPALVAPERTVVTTGLSKSLALGGWRIGVAALPEPLAPDLLPALVGIGSEVWSAMPAPMQDVAAYAYEEPPELADRVAASRHLHGAVAEALRDVFADAGAACRAPQGGFYLYPDFEAHREVLAAREITTGPDLSRALLDQGVGVLAGDAFGEPTSALTFRAATSLLYGATDEQRLAALESDQPRRLPWIAEALDTVRRAADRLLT